MITSLLLPNVALDDLAIHDLYIEYLADWREKAIQAADNGELASSVCQQACIIDIALHGKIKHDWLTLMDELLTHDGRPLAYSERYGKKLYKFSGQYLQSAIHSIYTRWWIESILRVDKIDHQYFANLILEKKQSDGLIYDGDISETTLRHRMKAELMLSMAMSTEILKKADQLTADSSLKFATSVIDPKKCPSLGYISAEYFRMRALQNLGYLNLFPAGIDESINSCTDGIAIGWGDFSIHSKVDAYMGTAKRAQRDKQIHSPIIALYVKALSLTTAQDKSLINEKLKTYASTLGRNPLDIPAFQMRDVKIPFGADITPLEVVSASYLIKNEI